MSMNRRRRRPLRKRFVSGDPAPPSNLARFLSRIATPWGVVTVCGAVILSLGLFCLFSWRKARSTSPVRPQVVSGTGTPQPIDKEIQADQTPAKQAATPPGTNVAEATPGSERQRTIADDNVLSSATPVSSPLADPTAVVSANQSHEMKRSEGERKSVERERREAERKRSRLESMYQKHLISDEAYKKGQDEYKSEMAKYRSTFNGTGSANE
jgi:type IV secretory pathway VirB10-like protein